MGSMLEVQFAGQLANDPKMQYTSGTEPKAVTNFSVAHNRKWGELDEVTWIRVTVWNAKAEACNQWLKKGSKVFIKGRLTPDMDTGGPRCWADKETGKPRASYEVTAFQVDFLGDLREASEAGYSGEGSFSQSVAGFEPDAFD